MNTLFSQLQKSQAPLAERMRPKKLDQVVGQSHLIGDGKPLTTLIRIDSIPSFLFWGPPGTGKTTLARIIAHETKSHFSQLSAVLSGVRELREIIEEAQQDRDSGGKKRILFIDEIHRWNKAQQDGLLPHVENGLITLIGSTTENPSFEINNALISRTKVYVLEPLAQSDIEALLRRALTDPENGLGKFDLNLSNNACSFMANHADGDARRALNALEISANLAINKNEKEIGVPLVEEALQKKSLIYDKKGEEHYNVISAFIKSMRGSDPDAAVYYLARMLEAGEDPLFCARRMVIFASEDIGNADPQAIQVAISCMQAFDFVGMPEGWIPLAQLATYLASAPKSNASYRAYQMAKIDISNMGALPTPKKLRNAPTEFMKDQGYGKNYKYAHNYETNFIAEHYLPEKIQEKIYYEPTKNGYESKISERLNYWRDLRNKSIK